MTQHRLAQVVWLGLAGFANYGLAQSQLNLAREAKNVNFSAAVATTPATVGATLPATCTIGQMFFKSNSAAGANLFSCTSSNVWTLETGGGGGGGGTTSAASIDSANFVAPFSGSGSAYVGSPASCSISLAPGQVYWLHPDVANTVSGPTLNTCSFGAKPILHRDGTGLGIGELAVGVYAYPMIFDGTSFELGYESPTTGPSNCLTPIRTSAQPEIDINPACVPQLPAGNVWTGANDFTASPFVGIPTGTPASSSATCTKGALQYDASFLYICIAANTWKRAGVATW